jgi:predicted nucleic acid-binding Zn ribbon protein
VLAARALEQAKADAQARGTSLPTLPHSNFSKRNDRTSVPTAAQPPLRQRREDPASLEAAIGGLINEAGWELAVATGSVFGRWAQIVGPDLAAHTSPVGLADGELIVTADSTAWATQLRLLAGQLVHRLNVELGDGSVRRVQVRGPGSGTRPPGRWQVKGSRGPRDTYG